MVHPFPFQDVPHYCLMLTLLVVCVDRYLLVSGRGHKRIGGSDGCGFSVPWALVLAWVLSIAVVLPYSAYITFIDLSVSFYENIWGCIFTRDLKRLLNGLVGKELG